MAGSGCFWFYLFIIIIIIIIILLVMYFVGIRYVVILLARISIISMINICARPYYTTLYSLIDDNKFYPTHSPFRPFSRRPWLPFLLLLQSIHRSMSLYDCSPASLTSVWAVEVHSLDHLTPSWSSAITLYWRRSWRSRRVIRTLIHLFIWTHQA